LTAIEDDILERIQYEALIDEFVSKRVRRMTFK